MAPSVCRAVLKCEPQANATVEEHESASGSATMVKPEQQVENQAEHDTNNDDKSKAEATSEAENKNKNETEAMDETGAAAETNIVDIKPVIPVILVPAAIKEEVENDDDTGSSDSSDYYTSIDRTEDLIQLYARIRN